MVFKAHVRVVVHAETLACLVIVVVHLAPSPSVTFYSEVVVASYGKFALSSPALKQSLCQRDACRDFVFHHLFDGQILVLVNV